jgi:hypothetical protein
MRFAKAIIGLVLVYVGVGSTDIWVHRYLATSETPTGETLRLLYLARGEANGRQNGAGFVTELAPCVLLGVGIGLVTHRLKVPLVACALLVVAFGVIPLEVTCVRMFPAAALDGPRTVAETLTFKNVFIVVVSLFPFCVLGRALMNGSRGGELNVTVHTPD